MKKLLLAFTLLLTFNPLFASHLSGGEIWYEYVGTSQHPNRYKVYLQIYRDISGVSLCTTANCTKTVCITSSCFGNQSLTVELMHFNPSAGSDTLLGTYGSIVTPGSNSCVSNGILVTEQYLFEGEVDLPGTCSDFTFSFAENARNPSDNLQNASSQDLYLVANLNNTLGSNNSPVFLTPAVKSFCVGTSFEWSHEAYDADGDSLFYVLSIPEDGTCGQASTPISYNSGYHQSSPITSSPPLHFNITNGLISFTPIQQEVVTFRVDIYEYRSNPTFGYLMIGRAMRDVQVPIVSSNNCGNFNRSLINDITMYPDSLPQLLCGDTSIFVKFNDQILNNSIASDGSDFAVTNSYGQLIPIKSATPTSSSFSSAYSYGVDLKLFTPLTYNDSIHLQVRTGSDLNTLVNTCGFQMATGDSLSFQIKGCQTTINLEENELPNISVYPNPTKDVLHITSSQSMKNCLLQLYDLRGMLIKEILLNTDAPSIDIKELPSGIYTVRLSNSTFVQKLQFQKL